MGKRKTERAGLPRRYTFKLYPTAEQAAELERQAQMCGDLWNALLERQEETYRRWLQGRSERARLTFFDMTAEITALRHECPEWAELSVWTAHRVAGALDEAFKAFFRRAKAGAGASSGYPRFRPRRLQTWLPHRGKSGFAMHQMQRDGCARQLDWLVSLKGFDAPIRAMGRFPSDPLIERHLDVDLRFRDGRWWLSVATEMAARGSHGPRPTIVRLDLIDCLAHVNGHPVKAHDIGLHLDDLLAERAEVQREMAPLKRGSDDWRECAERLSRLSAKTARRRREALHVWTTSLVRQASRVSVIRPASIKHDTASGRGDERSWGAAVETKAEMNRAVLAQAPGMVLQMLAYKAAEAGIEYSETAAPTLAVGTDTVRTAKATRRARREARKAAA
ncbi:ORFB of an IS200/IS605 insertion sequence family IS1341 group [Stappia sp. 22II-S9-Z10]|nr:ORFB of an IS200/IS605 insertion sequence family IS1341 group [Stappia sp. 22II-S9-Z10]